MLLFKADMEISDSYRQILRNDFLRTMHQRFLDGQDSEHFDYKYVTPYSFSQVTITLIYYNTFNKITM